MTSNTPKIDEIYEFTNYDETLATLKVVAVDTLHVWYKWNEAIALHVYPMTLELWNSEEYRLVDQFPMVDTGEGAPQYTFDVAPETQLSLF